MQQFHTKVLRCPLLEWSQKLTVLPTSWSWLFTFITGQWSFPRGTFPLHCTSRTIPGTVHCSVMTLVKILQVWQIEAPPIWRFLSQANLSSLSLRIYSLCHTLSAPSPQHRMWHYLFFMILAGTQKGKREMRAAVQDGETEQGANFLPDSGSISSASSSNVWFLPKEISPPFLLFQMKLFRSLTAWTTCCRSLSFLSLYSTPRAVASNPCLEIPKGNPTNYWKRANGK